MQLAYAQSLRDGQQLRRGGGGGVHGLRGGVRVQEEGGESGAGGGQSGAGGGGLRGNTHTHTHTHTAEYAMSDDDLRAIMQVEP